MDVHLVDGTYELFRQYYGQKGRPKAAADGLDVGAVVGVMGSVLAMIDDGATHLAVATDHRIESFRNELWPDYKSSAGVDPALLAQFPILERALGSLGIAVLAMDELEADDALASAAAVAAVDPRVGRVSIWTPDKDLAQCVRGERVVQVDRRSGTICDEEAVVAKFGVRPESIPDWLGLVGDSADGFPGLRGWGKQSAAAVLWRYGHLEQIPPAATEWDPELAKRVRSASTLADRLSAELALALLFRDLATLRIDRSLVASVDALEWSGPTAEVDEVAGYLGSRRIAERAVALAARAK
jgi:5'-3' exonuclease